MADFWNHLVTTALLGTDKQAFDETLLPEPIRKVVQQADKKDKEELFYKTATVAAHYYKAGALPQKLDLLTGKPCEPEEQRYASPQAVGILRKILSYENGNPALVEKWLKECGKKSWIVPPEQLLTVLNLGLDKKYMHLQRQIESVTGRRGQWMVQFNSEWNYLQEPDYQSIWEEGKTAERKAALEHIRKTNPAQARELLEKTWRQETAKNKLDLLTVLATNLSPEDEPFLQQVFDEIQSLRQKKKDAVPDLLKQTVELLLCLPDSQLSREIWDKTKRYIRKKPGKKLLGFVASETIVLELPVKEDDFLCKETMWHRLGISEESNHKSTYSDVEDWMYKLLTRIPPHHWQEHLSASAEEILSAFAKNAGFLKESEMNKGPFTLYTVALAEAAHFHQDTTWGHTWLTFFKDKYEIQKSNVSYLFAYLPDKELENFYIQYLDMSNAAPHSQSIRDELVRRQEHLWTLAFTQYVTKALCADLKSYGYGNTISFLNQAVVHMHPDIRKEDLNAYMPSDVQTWVRTQYERTVVQPLQEMMALRLEMEQVFGEEK